MAPSYPSLLDRPIGFAHRGARAHAQENTLEAFKLATRLGAGGIESDVWVTKDDVAVLDHDGKIGRRPFRRPVRSFKASKLPDHIPSLEEYYDEIGTNLPLSLDVKDDAAFQTVLAAARNASDNAEENLWLCHPNHEVLTGWRTQTSARLVDSTRSKHLKGGAERRASRLRERGIDAINLRQGDWSAGLVALFHRFDLLTLGWDAQQPRQLANLLDAGIDGVFSDHVDRMADAIESFYGQADP